jgi:hypothetical protein
MTRLLDDGTPDTLPPDLRPLLLRPLDDSDAEFVELFLLDGRGAIHQRVVRRNPTCEIGKRSIESGRAALPGDLTPPA